MSKPHAPGQKNPASSSQQYDSQQQRDPLQERCLSLLHPQAIPATPKANQVSPCIGGSSVETHPGGNGIVGAVGYAIITYFSGEICGTTLKAISVRNCTNPTFAAGPAQFEFTERMLHQPCTSRLPISSTNPMLRPGRSFLPSENLKPRRCRSDRTRFSGTVSGPLMRRMFQLRRAAVSLSIFFCPQTSGDWVPAAIYF